MTILFSLLADFFFPSLHIFRQLGQSVRNWFLPPSAQIHHTEFHWLNVFIGITLLGVIFGIVVILAKFTG